MAETPPPDMVTAQVEDVALVGRRREQIVAAATKLFSRQGYYKTTVKREPRYQAFSAQECAAITS